MEIIFTILLAIAAFLVGAIPFSVIIGHLFLKKDVTHYGDGNPGAVNVFRAGGHKSGFLAVLLDVAKGVPFVLLAHTLTGLNIASVIIIAICAILGHAFSPFLHWRGGKAIAVTFGVLLALPEHEILLAFIAFTVLGFLFIEVDAWTIIFGAAGTLAYLGITRGSSWEPLLMFLILTILIIKHFEALHTLPGFKGRLFRWVQSIIRGAMSIL
jgi:glycerol-3-phosphate acyltransferase PlsY